MQRRFLSKFNSTLLTGVGPVKHGLIFMRSGLYDFPKMLLRHQNKANVVFCDGHVESPTLQFLFADTSDAALSRWNRDYQPHRERLAP